MSFCAICTNEAADLERSDDGFLECGRCRDEHPNYRGYSFDGGVAAADALGSGNRQGTASPSRSGVLYMPRKR